MDRNYIVYPLFITGLVIAVLLAVSFIPEQTIADLGIRQMDILSDIRKDTAENETYLEAVLLPALPVEKEKKIPCPQGTVCFEDYSQDGDGLSAFLQALDYADKQNVRIAFFGDSYIEGDIFSGDLRAFLQEKYGGRGVGMVLPVSHVASFRKTVEHSFGGWNNFSIIDGNDNTKMGVSGNYCTPSGNAWVKYSGVKRPNLDYVSKVSLIYRLPSGNATVSYRINNSKEPVSVNLDCSPTVTSYDIAADSIGNIRLDFASGNNIHIYGVSMQSETGVAVDNFSLRGAPGTTLKYLPENIVKQTDSVLNNYNLIILQYGLNVMSANNKNYSTYKKGMKETVEHLKKCFPKSSILLLSVGDRSMRKSGEYVTMPCVEAMVETQREICAETGIVFWNLFEAMGGVGSMVELVASIPPKANKDYTHLNFEGGKYLGEKLFNTIIFEKSKFDKKNRNRYGKPVVKNG
ncbi:MAG: hypothetical protein LBG92_01935 [Prevotellaceae bacterium]|nr:hypothetical protein [Prevotellaceae bacterium]